jgi:hypothetical protein
MTLATSSVLGAPAFLKGSEFPQSTWLRLFALPRGYGAPALLLLSITGPIAEVVSWVPSLEVLLSPRSYAAKTVTTVTLVSIA